MKRLGWFYTLVGFTLVVQVVCAAIDIHRHQWIQLVILLVSMGFMLWSTWRMRQIVNEWQRKQAALDEWHRRRSGEP